jgi:hypothetical protein
MVAEVDVIFPIFTLQDSIRKRVNFSQIFQFTRKKAAMFALVFTETQLT